MDARALRLSVLVLLLCFLSVSDASKAEKPHHEAIKKSQKLEYQEDAFPADQAVMELDTTPGTIPIVNPTPIPAVNPYQPAPSTNPITNPPPSTNPITNPPPSNNPITNPTPSTNPTPTTNPPPTTTTPGTSGGSWCIAIASASQTALQVALDYACGYGGADCSAIQSGASCYEPNTLKDHASYAFNQYYQKNPNPTSCAFGGTAQLTSTDPSSGSCRYQSSKSTSTTPPSTPTTPPMTPLTPPSTTTPVTPYLPGGQPGFGSEPTDYGSEPTGTPSSAETTSRSQFLLFTATFLLLLLAEINRV